MTIGAKMRRRRQETHHIVVSTTEDPTRRGQLLFEVVNGEGRSLLYCKCHSYPRPHETRGTSNREANRESPSSPATSSEVADLRRELAELRRELRGGRAGPDDEADDQGDAGGAR